MDIWDTHSKDNNREQWDEIFNSSPEDRYLIVIDTFVNLRDLAQAAIDGSLDKNDACSVRDLDLPTHAIVAYCDTKTSINTDCVIDLLHAMHARTTSTKSFGGGLTRFGRSLDTEEFEVLLTMLWKVQDRIGNHLFSLTGDTEREKVADEIGKWSEPIPYKFLRKIFHVSQETLINMIKNETIVVHETRGSDRKKVVLKSCMPTDWEQYLPRKSDRKKVGLRSSVPSDWEQYPPRKSD
ncbi:MAG: hypothetical protein K0U90_08425 [Planctomycetes bacterium]|nr:hypothetical protein [Planctomycetota bacterium]MCH9776444.1 hypothetical protein [Planctomycetota bacterium]